MKLKYILMGMAIAVIGSFTILFFSSFTESNKEYIYVTFDIYESDVYYWTNKEGKLTNVQLNELDGLNIQEKTNVRMTEITNNYAAEGYELSEIINYTSNKVYFLVFEK